MLGCSTCTAGGFVAVSYEARAAGIRCGDGAGAAGRAAIPHLRHMQVIGARRALTGPAVLSQLLSWACRARALGEQQNLRQLGSQGCQAPSAYVVSTQPAFSCWVCVVFCPRPVPACRRLFLPVTACHWMSPSAPAFHACAGCQPGGVPPALPRAAGTAHAYGAVQRGERWYRG